MLKYHWQCEINTGSLPVYSSPGKTDTQNKYEKPLLQLNYVELFLVYALLTVKFQGGSNKKTKRKDLNNSCD